MLFADWSDADTINALLGASGLGGVVWAVWYGLTRYSRQRASNAVSIKKAELEATVQEDKVESDRLAKWQRETKNLIKLQDERIADLDDRLVAKDAEIKALIAEKELEIKALRMDVTICQQERATLVEQGKWMKRILKKHGLLSDDDEEEFPRTKSDQIDTPRNNP